MLKEVEPLKDHADLGTLVADLLVVALVQSTVALLVPHQVAVDKEFARVVLLEVIDAAKKRALARARRSDEAGHLSSTDRQGDAFEHLDSRVRLVDVARVDHRGAHVVLGTP